MMRLYSEWRYLEQEFGCSIRDNFLMAVRSLDNPKAVTPLLIENRNRKYGLFLHVEKGNVAAARLPPAITAIYYRPYFTFEPSERPPHVHATLGDAIASIAGGERDIVIDRHAPLSVAAELGTGFAVRMDDAPEFGTVTLCKVDNAETVARLGRGRGAAAKAARKLVSRSPARRGLEPYLGAQQDDRFAALDRHLAHEGLQAVLVSSTLNVQEIAGVPVWRKHRPLAALYIAGEKHAWVIEHGRAAGGQEFPSPAAALDRVFARGRLGVEVEDVDLGLARAFGLEARDSAPADRALRQWRDENTLPDLPYYIIATRASRQALDAALEFAAAALRRNQPITEMDSYAVYLRTMREFAADALPGTRVARTLTNFHTGARTIFPANPAPYPVDDAMNNLKIDAGCLLFDEQGFMLGCSDIARTLVPSEAGTQLYELFQSGVRQRLIPGAAAGRTGEELHTAGVAHVWNNRAALSGNPLFVDLAAPALEYDRDVGHLLGKNNLAHLRLVHGDKQRLREGMIACCEYQWPARGHAIAYEDTCLVTPAGGLNLTSDEE